MIKKLNNYLPLLILTVFPLGQLLNIPLSNPDLKIYLHDILISIYLLLNYTRLFKLFIQEKELQGFALFSFFSLLLISSKLPFADVVIGSFYLIRLITYISFGMLLASYYRATRKTAYMFFAITTALVLGFGQFFLFPSLEPLFILGWDRHAFRLVGSWLDPGFTGAIFILFFIWVNAFKVKLSKSWLTPKIINLLLIAIATAILFTYSRATYLAFTGWLIYSFSVKTSRKLAVSALILLIALTPFLPRQIGEGTKLERTSTITSRLNNWQESTQIIAGNPMFGVGFNTLRYIKGNQHDLTQSLRSNAASGIDNSFLLLAATTGIFGLWQFFLLIIRIYRVYSPSDLKSQYIPILIHSLFSTTLLYPWVLVWFCFTWKKKTSLRA